MLDRHGWHLEIGDRVTITRPDRDHAHLYGQHCIVLEAHGNSVDVMLTSPLATADAGATVSIFSHCLEYGHLHRAADLDEFARAFQVHGASCVRDAVRAAVQESIITREQAVRLTKSWQARSDRDDSLEL